MSSCRINTIVVVFLALSFSIGVSSAASTQSEAMLKIAEIMHRLKHFPSPVGKTTLKNLAKQASTTTNEKTLIEAMLNLQHQISTADRGKLTALVEDKKTHSSVRSIATILVNLDHRPTKQDKLLLKKILGK